MAVIISKKYTRGVTSSFSFSFSSSTSSSSSSSSSSSYYYYYYESSNCSGLICEAGNDCLSSQYVISLSTLLEGLLP